MTLYAECMKERYGYDVIEHEYGFLTYRIDSDVCTAIEIFIGEYHRGSGSWQLLFQELLGICLVRGAKTIIGFVDVTKPEPSIRLVAYIRSGARVKEARENMIVLEWEVPKNGG